MLDPYRLVFIYFISFSFFVLSLLLIRKQKNFYFLLVFFSSLLPIFSLLRKGVHQSGDFAINITKSIDIWVSLSHGIFPVHWASLLNATYGYPLFLFTYPLPYYSIVIFKLFGFSFIASEKIVIGLVFVLSGIAMYFLSRLFLKKPQSALVSVLYLFAPYHLVDLHYRVALGELFAFMFLPMIFYFFVKSLRKEAKFSPIFLSLSVAGLILSHQAISLIVAPFLLLIPLLLNLKILRILKLYFYLLMSLLVSAFYWLPLLSSISSTHQPVYSKTIGFENPLLYLLSPWKYSLLYQGPFGELAFPIGIVQLTLLIFGIHLLLKRGLTLVHAKIYKGILAALLLMLILLLPLSKVLWEILPLITNFQFAYRLMLPISFLVSLAGGIAASKIKSKKVVAITLLSILLTIANWGPRYMIADITDENLMMRTPFATYEAEGLQPAAPKWTDISSPWTQHPPEKHLQFITGSGVINSFARTPTTHEYLIKVNMPSMLQENTLYFPGWNLYLNGERANVFPSQNKGVVRFEVKEGLYHVLLRFERTPVVTIANTATLLSLIILAIALIKSARKKYVS